MQQLSELTLKAPHEKSPAENQRRDYSRLWLALVMISLIGLTIVSFTQFDTKGVDIPEAALASLNNIRVMFQELRLSHISLQTALINVLITFSLALITTFIAALISFFLALLAAKNFSSGLMSNIVKGLVAFIRAVPTVLWVLIFAISAGLGAEACVMGLCFHAVSAGMSVTKRTDPSSTARWSAVCEARTPRLSCGRSAARTMRGTPA